MDNRWKSFQHPRLSETAAADQCDKCGSAIWSLFCRTGFRVHLDPELVTPAQDLEFYLARRRTYRVWQVGYGFETELRSNNAIKWETEPTMALPAHICDRTNVRTELPDYFPRPAANYIEEPLF